MHTLINGKAIAEKLNRATRALLRRLKKKGLTPRLNVILVGHNPASETYVRKKGEAAKTLGIDFKLYRLSVGVQKEKIIALIKKLNRENYSGTIIQLPLPERLYIPEVLNAVSPNADVDCLTETNLGKLVMNTQTFVPPTPGAVMKILESLKIRLSGKNITLVGTGALVGKPLAILLTNAGASVTTVNSRTKNTKQKCLSAEIIVSGVGKAHLVRGDMIKPGAIVVDTGFAYLKGKVVGDVNVYEALKVAKAVTPTPGGVGPVTVAHLLYNTTLAAERSSSRRS